MQPQENHPQEDLEPRIQQPMDRQADPVREVVGLFGSVDDLQSAIDELLTKGFDRSEISLLAEDDIVREKVGDRSARELEDSPDAPRTAYVESESLNEGKASLVGILFYVGAFAGAAIVTMYGGSAMTVLLSALGAGMLGALLGVLASKLIDNRETHWAKAQLKRGGLLLWARVWDEQRAGVATEIMRRNGGSDVHLHAMPG